MARIGASEAAKRRAFDHVIGSIDFAACFPEQVFRGSWAVFLFFEADRVFAPGFAEIMSGFLNVEQAEVCCLLNFSETDDIAFETGDTLYIDARIEPHTYDAMLRQGGPAKGWLFGMDRYGGSSDRGEWALYCEKGNDIAVIALRQPDDAGKYVQYLNRLHAELITVLLRAGTTEIVPFNRLIEPWRHGLNQHYSGSVIAPD